MTNKIPCIYIKKLFYALINKIQFDILSIYHAYKFSMNTFRK